jgi:LacI family transcriptional regulator
MLVRSSPVPLYHQLAQQLEAEIVAGKYPVTKPFFSDKELVSRYGLSLLTVRQAMSELVKKGLLERRQGKGTFLTKSVAGRVKNGKVKQQVILFTGWGLAQLSSWESMYFHDIFKGIQAEADNRGLRVLVDDGKPGAGLHLNLDVDVCTLVGAVALVGSESEARALELQGLGVNTVTVNFAVDGLPAIVPDDYRGGRLATQYLLDAGCRRLAHFNSGEPAHWLDVKRAYLDVLRDAGRASAEHPVFISPLRCGSLEAGQQLARQVWEQHGPVDGIFAGNDLMSVGALQYFRDAGVAVPDQVQLIGFDNIDLATISTPALTTVAVDRRELGRRAVARLCQDRSSHEDNHIREVLDVRLEVRGSTAALTAVPV